MFPDIKCPQCRKATSGPSCRLVRDSCGHQKCRVCLLADEERCLQCKKEELAPKPKDSVIRCESNHTGVITCGSLVATEVCSKIVNAIDRIEAHNKTCGAIKTVLNPKQDNMLQQEGRNNANKNCVTVPTVKKINGKKSNFIIPSHVSVSREPTKYKCNICCRQFNTKSQIKYHIYCNGASKPFRCLQCPKDFITKSQYEIHMLNHAGSKPFVCKECGKSFSEKGKLKRHGILHSVEKPYVCAECGKTFRANESLKLHTLIHRGERPFKCKVCNAAFNNTSNLNKHLITHSKEKVHMCDQCGKRFKFKWTLTVHRRSHLRLRPFECKNCCRAFVNNKDLQRHQLIHLETKPFNCSICMTGFRRKDNLYRHVKNTHPGKKAEPVAETVKKLIVKPTKQPVDNPNAIKVITTSPVCVKTSSASVKNEKQQENRTVINGPLKLAFKTTAFKSNYNINRTFDFDTKSPKIINKSYDMAESVNICQKILSPHSPPHLRNSNSVIESTSNEICQKILTPYTPAGAIHYETSFEHKKHAIIKNIKFKLPPNYTNLKMNDALNDLVPLKAVNNVNLQIEKEYHNMNNTYTELKAVQNTATSVIVNNNYNMHWRRRTSQHLNSKIVEN